MIALTSEQRQSVERTFRELAARWTDLTAYRSNVGALREHPVAREIIALGEPAIPLLLRELAREPAVSWMVLLAATSGEDPVPPEAAGRVAAMARAWLDWGRMRGHFE